MSFTHSPGVGDPYSRAPTWPCCPLLEGVEAAEAIRVVRPQELRHRQREEMPGL